ncbi:MAG: endonuclease/exonuclease/phosphatase family protein [Pseudomonadota bacterium]
MRVVTYNIRYGWGLDHKVDLARIAAAVHGADIIALQEVERYWQHSGMADQPARLSELLSDYYWAYGPAFDVDASTKGEDGRILNRRRQFGTMLLSKRPIRASRLMVLPKIPQPHQFNLDTGALECILDSDLGPLRVYSLHLGSLSAEERLRQVEMLLARHRSLTPRDGPWTGDGQSDDPGEREQFQLCNWSNGEQLLDMPLSGLWLGDFNCEPDSAEYDRMVGPAPDGKDGDGTVRLVDSWTQVTIKNRDEEEATWRPDPPGRAPGRAMRLDYCFVTADLAGRVCDAWIDQTANGSDHRPYWVNLI